MRNIIPHLRQKRKYITGFFGSGKDERVKQKYAVDIGPMVPGRKKSKPIKNDPEEKSAFLFPRWETKYVDSIDVLGMELYYSVVRYTVDIMGF